MSDEKRREELKAKINEQLDKLSIEELESVAGGGFVINGKEGKEKECQLCGKTFLSFGSNYCDACEWIMQHGISK